MVHILKDRYNFEDQDSNAKWTGSPLMFILL